MQPASALLGRGQWELRLHNPCQQAVHGNNCVHGLSCRFEPASFDRRRSRPSQPEAAARGSAGAPRAAAQSTVAVPAGGGGGVGGRRIAAGHASIPPAHSAA